MPMTRPAALLLRLAALFSSLPSFARADKVVGDPIARDYSHDCWVPDYCEPEHFYYKLCKLRLRGRAATKQSEYVCPEGYYCEELECAHRCWLPPECWCADKGHHEGRMMCTDGGCFEHPTTQWGLCRPEPAHHELPDHEHPEEEEPILPTGFHFYSQDELLYNSKLHIDEDHKYSRPRVPKYETQAAYEADKARFKEEL